MKRTTLIAMFALVLGAAYILAENLNAKPESFPLSEARSKTLLAEVLKNLNNVKSATYSAKIEAYAPGDTSAFDTRFHYFKEYDNPADTTIGASYVELQQQDTTKMFLCYDGNMKALVWKEKYMLIDSFEVTRSNTPFRKVSPPFFNYTRSIIKYALETNDSITVDLKDFGDSLQFSLTIHEEDQVEFFGKPYYLNNPYYGAEVSKYDIWISKANGLPYRVRREMSQGVVVTTCRNIKLNKSSIKDFVASKYIPADVPVRKDIPRNNLSLLNKTAPDWVLKGSDNQTVSLKQLKSKVVLIQFTSVNCGPCRVSVPFLNNLITAYDEKDLGLVSIESTSRNSMVLEKYQQKSGIKYDFLMSSDDVNKSYQIQAFPVFYLLDSNRVIRKVIVGYGKGTDKEIKDAINELI